MRSYHLAKRGGVDGLEIREHPIPEVQGGEVLVRLKASSLNYRDVAILLGYYLASDAPLVPLSDGAGEVVAVGRGVTRFRIGDRVMGTFFVDRAGGRARGANLDALGGHVDGVLTEYRVFDQSALVATPAHLSDEEAATLPCAALTAWSALSGGHAPLQPGDWVLVQGTGGVSVFALQLAKLSGARVVATTSSAAKEERLKALGADVTINYTERADWDRVVRDVTGGVDKAVDMGGAGTLARTISTLAEDGHAAVVGFFENGADAGIPGSVFNTLFTLERVGVGTRAAFEDMNRAITAHALHPVIDRVFPFVEARAAFTRMIERRHIGKIVIRHD
jgi:NADPH:quinone reductase-like Zn-dependent oxidoreductase